ncbi:MAG: signal peptidase I [Phycisphaerales bacterium]|nr:signal peptidase I [Phycisphaerales bacterium]
MKTSEPRPSRRAQPQKESWIEQSASFIGFFIYLLILKSFFLPLFIIPTGSMAETLRGAHAFCTCPNCGVAFAVGWQPLHGMQPYHPVTQCPNCRWRQSPQSPAAIAPPRGQPDNRSARPLAATAGDRIFVHGWTYDWPFAAVPGLGPARWDVVVFKVPTDGQTNYIKRLIALPGERVELINGDVFINDELAAKPDLVQRSLWFPYYNHDFAPRQPAGQANYWPRWAPLGGTGWEALDTRAPHFAGSGPATIHFASDPLDSQRPGRVQDVYGYNEPRVDFPVKNVCDVRLSTEIRFDSAAPAGGYVELSTTYDTHQFHARLHQDGRIQLLHSRHATARAEDIVEPVLCGERAGIDTTHPRHLAVYHVDGRVGVQLDGETLDLPQPAGYRLTSQNARRLSIEQPTARLRITAVGTALTLRHLLIERDVYYLSEVQHGHYGTQGSALTLARHQYYLLGDNSPSSQDSRFGFGRDQASAIGPHLRAAAAAGEYQPGTVTADQLIGRAFLVYWPGFLRMPVVGVPLLPDFGNVRWIH